MRRRSDAPDDNTSERLEAYVARTEDPLNLVALFTLWIVVVPVANFGPGDSATWWGVAFRVGVSAIFAIDLAIRAVLAPRSWHYVATHPVRLLAVVIPPIRVVFSVQLISSLFRRGNLVRFLVAATILMVDGALIVYFLERDATGATITTPAGAIWWGIVTVATVGYGDMYPITPWGRAVASMMMAIGITTIAVVTAQVSSSFASQPRARRGPDRRGWRWLRGDGRTDAPRGADAVGEVVDDDSPDDATQLDDAPTSRPELADELLERLERIERRLTELGEAPPR